MALVASQMVGVVILRYLLRAEPLASMPPDDSSRSTRPPLQRYLTGPPWGPSPTCPTPRSRRTIQHMMKNAVEVRDLVVVRGGHEVLRTSTSPSAAG